MVSSSTEGAAGRAEMLFRSIASSRPFYRCTIKVSHSHVSSALTSCILRCTSHPCASHCCSELWLICRLVMYTLYNLPRTFSVSQAGTKGLHIDLEKSADDCQSHTTKAATWLHICARRSCVCLREITPPQKGTQVDFKASYLNRWSSFFFFFF